MQLVLLLCLGWAFASVVSNFPHQLCYFNEAAGGPENGYQHLLGSSFDWGQADGAAILRAETIFPNFDVTTVPPLKRNEFSKARERISDTANSKSTGRVVVFGRSVYAVLECPDWNSNADVKFVQDSVALQRHIVSLTPLHDAILTGAKD